MSQAIPGRILLAIDITGHDAVEIPPADKHADGDAALVDALDVVGDPGDGVGDAGVDAEGAEEGGEVGDGGGGLREEEGEAEDGEEGEGEVEEAALAETVGVEADEDGEETGADVGWGWVSSRWYFDILFGGAYEGRRGVGLWWS